MENINANFITYDAEQNSLKVIENDELAIGTHNLLLTASINGTAIAEQFEFNITISCPDTPVDSKLTIPIQSVLDYEIGKSGKVYIQLPQI